MRALSCKSALEAVVYLLLYKVGDEPVEAKERIDRALYSSLSAASFIVPQKCNL